LALLLLIDTFEYPFVQRPSAIPRYFVNSISLRMTDHDSTRVDPVSGDILPPSTFSPPPPFPHHEDIHGADRKRLLEPNVMSKAIPADGVWALGQTPPRSAFKRLRYHIVDRWWILELLSVVVGFLVLGIYLFILLWFNDKPSRYWPNLRIANCSNSLSLSSMTTTVVMLKTKLAVFYLRCYHIKA
jgi:hypothetical protein